MAVVTAERLLTAEESVTAQRRDAHGTGAQENGRHEHADAATGQVCRRSFTCWNGFRKTVLWATS